LSETIAHDHRRGSSLEEVFLDERVRLLAFLRRIGAGEDAEDILHDAWIRIRSLDRPMPAEAISYLYRTLHNLVIDRRRSSRRLVHRDTHWAEAVGDASGRCAQPDSERRLLAIDEVRAIHEAIDALGEPGADIFRRHRLQGQTQRAIADELEMGLSTVEKHLRRAYAALLAFRRAGDDV
jgi:RNA polymerase sigma-70 factor (ECF subfamily)